MRYLSKKESNSKLILLLNIEQGTRNVDFRSICSILQSSIGIPCSKFKSNLHLILSYCLSKYSYLFIVLAFLFSACLGRNRSGY